MNRVATLVLVMLAMSASAAVDARALAHEGQKTQWAPTRNFSSLNARAVFGGESRGATSPYAGEESETAAGEKDWQYAAGNPMRFVDPDGRRDQTLQEQLEIGQWKSLAWQLRAEHEALLRSQSPSRQWLTNSRIGTGPNVADALDVLRRNIEQREAAIAAAPDKVPVVEGAEAGAFNFGGVGPYREMLFAEATAPSGQASMSLPRYPNWHEYTLDDSMASSPLHAMNAVANVAAPFIAKIEARSMGPAMARGAALEPVRVAEPKPFVVGGRSRPSGGVTGPWARPGLTTDLASRGQEGPYTCGVACVRELIRRATGNDVSETALLKDIGYNKTPADGLPATELQTLLKKHIGPQWRIDVDFAAYDQMKSPETVQHDSIILLKNGGRGGHWVILESSTATTATIWDPWGANAPQPGAGARWTTPHQNLENLWRQGQWQAINKGK